MDQALRIHIKECEESFWKGTRLHISLIFHYGKVYVHQIWEGRI